MEEEIKMARATKKASAGKSARKPAKRAAPHKSHSKKSAPPAVASRLPATTPEKVEAAKRKFEEGVLARGEAVPAGKPLPPGATHEIIGTDANGRPILKRKRYSLK